MKKEKNQTDKQLVRNTFERYNGIYGYRQIQLFLYQDCVWMNHKKILRLMQDMGLRSKTRRKYRNCNRTWNFGERAVGAQISMSRRGNCYDNVSMESFFSHLKVEGLYPYNFRTVEEAQMRIESYIYFYNNSRPQRKLNKLTPVQYRNQLVGRGYF
ncbi:IS3 family transposase [Paenibacillus arenosi]|uniref:IS3 family transposase n=1 Tax=Paenibacillus arenosi TaxID=2774142 RepID=A0ABR9B016_9BACL|nr:IS3 family transposase [Paenibacillus arenosi]MBD8499738.1 IS3 family transposase [Paenibacillus arenosi]